MPDFSTGTDFDVLGIGVGPFNLSTAALIDSVTGVSSKFVDAKSGFDWHRGLQFPGATIQSPFLKDLVTLVDPTNQFSFLNYLASNRRLNRFIVADYPNVTRREFTEYFRWVAAHLTNVEFGVEVTDVDIDATGFVVGADGREFRARDLVLGVGRLPFIPPAVVEHLGESVFHASEYLERSFTRAGKRIAVVGGGQTGAEIFQDLIAERPDHPASVAWITRRSNFAPFDESPFANELYVPGYTRFFYRQPMAERERLLREQKLSSDAILQPLLESIYRRLYELDYLDGRRIGYTLLVDREMTTLTRVDSGWQIEVSGPSGVEKLEADVVILATGYAFGLPAILDRISGRIQTDNRGHPLVNEDFSLQWDGPAKNRIFVHNMALHSHGWVDPNFAGMAWRSGVIVNSVVGKEIYAVDIDGTTVDWGGPSLAGAVDHR